MSSSTPAFHQQFYRTYFLMFFALMVLAVASYGLMKVREHKFVQQLDLQIPQMQKNSEQLALVRAAEINLQALNTGTIATDFVELHQALEKQLLTLTQQVDFLAIADFEYLAKQTDANQIIRIAGKDTLNRNLIDKSQTLLSNTLLSLNQVIALKSERAEELYNLIKNERAGEATTISRARAHAQLMLGLKHDLIALNHLQAIAAQIALFNLQSPDLFIDHVDSLSQQLFAWFEQFSQTIANEDKALFEQLTLLNRVLVTDDRLIAKWRGHLRLYKAYQQLLYTQKSQLSNATNHLSKQVRNIGGEVSVHDLVPVWLQEQLASKGIKLNHQILQLTLLVVMALAISMILLSILVLNRRIQSSAQQQISFVKNCLSANNQPEKSPALKIKNDEQGQLYQLLNNIVNPGFTRDDMLKIKADHQQLLTEFCQNYQVTQWQLSNASEQQPLQRLMGTWFDNFTMTSLFSFRAVFNRQTCRDFIKAARAVKKNHRSQQVILESLAGTTLLVSIHYDEQSFILYGAVGEIFNQDSNSHLMEVNHLHAEIDNLRQQQLVNNGSLAKAVNNRVIQAMLQSQAESLMHKTPVSSLYRQLYRMLVWAKENQLSAEIGQKELALSLVDTCLQDQILAALANLSTEFKGQRNRYQFQDNLAERYSVQFDAQLFEALILGIARIMVARQRNCELLLSANLTDKNDGQYIVGYKFTLITEHSSAEAKAPIVPAEISELLQTAECTDELSDNNQTLLNTNNYSRLLRQLLQRLFARELLLEETETGYQFSFELPHTSINKVSEDSLLLELTNKRFLYITTALTSKVSQNLMVSALEEAKAQVDRVAYENLDKELTVEQLQRQSLHAVIVSEVSRYPELSFTINALPEKLRPKLYCLAGKAHLATSIHQGVFDQIALPFNKHAFIRGLKTLLTGEPFDNLQIDKQAMDKATYLNSGIEVLLAVRDFSQYAVLYQVLNYFGFSVTIAASEAEMMPLWRSGRHLILISEFNASPIIALDNGKQVQRGVIATSQQLINTWQQETNASQWHFACLPARLTIENLTEILSTWLVVQEPVIKTASNRATKKVDLDFQFKSVSPVRNQQAAFEDLPAVFNIAKFANNQAGVECAAYMLDEYITENLQLAQKLNYVLSVKSHEHVKEYLAQLSLNAKILSADNLLTLCREIEVNVAQQHYHDCERLMPKIIEEVQLIAQYAEAI
ncbi:MAG: hypothetical protein ACSHW0_12190 [Thalassotalea sp.]